MTELQITSLLDKKLASYSLLGAAVMGVSAVANASVVVVPVNETFGQGSNFNLSLSPASQGVGGSPDLTISGNFDFYYIGAENNVTVGTANGAEVLFDGTDSYPAALGGSTTISSASGTFGSGGNLTASGFKITPGYYTNGDFSSNGGSAYLGFYFVGPGGDQAGWVDVSTSSSFGLTAGNNISGTSSFTVNDYAYETAANTAITTPAATPEPSTLSLLAMGAAGVAALRRRYAARA